MAWVFVELDNHFTQIKPQNLVDKFMEMSLGDHLTQINLKTGLIFETCHKKLAV